MVVKRLKRYKDLPYEEKRKVVSLVFEEAKRMKQEGKRINYHELSRIVLTKMGVHLGHSTIRGWFTGLYKPMGGYKAIRRPPDEHSQVIRGLALTDITCSRRWQTIMLTLHTTKDFFIYSLQRFFIRYGFVAVKPTLIRQKAEWEMRAYFDYSQWSRELQRPIFELTEGERLKLLSGAISGDGWIVLHNINQRRINFAVGLSSIQKSKTLLFHKVLESLKIRHCLAKRLYEDSRTEDSTTQPRPHYEYMVIVVARNAVKRLLAHLKLLQPFREVKRVLALRFIEKDVLDRDLVKPVWEYLRVVEKYSTIRSQIRACELIPDERFDKKNLNKQRMLKQLRRKLYKYADAVRNLKPRATRIISGIKPSP